MHFVILILQFIRFDLIEAGAQAVMNHLASHPKVPQYIRKAAQTAHNNLSLPISASVAHMRSTYSSPMEEDIVLLGSLDDDMEVHSPTNNANYYNNNYPNNYNNYNNYNNFNSGNVNNISSPPPPHPEVAPFARPRISFPSL